MNFQLVVTETDSPVIENNKLVVWDANSNCPVHLDMTRENLALFNLQSLSVETDFLDDTDSGSKTDENQLQKKQLSDITSKKASWKDNNAIKILIDEWRSHESYFKSTTITNKKVWEMISNKLKKENPLWNFTGQQCEDKFKDLRKHYVKAKDQNERSSGLPVATCKFYEEMDEALGDKPAIKPVSIASTLKKHKQPDIESSASTSEFIDSNSESCNDNMSIPKTKKRKISITERNIERLLALRTEESKKKEEAHQKRHAERMQRQDHAIEIYEKTMNRLLEKL